MASANVKKLRRIVSDLTALNQSVGTQIQKLQRLSLQSQSHSAGLLAPVDHAPGSAVRTPAENWVLDQIDTNPVIAMDELDELGKRVNIRGAVLNLTLDKLVAAGELRKFEVLEIERTSFTRPVSRPTCMLAWSRDPKSTVPAESVTLIRERLRESMIPWDKRGEEPMTADEWEAIILAFVQRSIPGASQSSAQQAADGITKHLGFCGFLPVADNPPE